LTEHMRKLARVAVAVGGFLMMIGIVFMSVTVLNLLNIIDVGALANEAYLHLFMLALLSVGVLDVVAGIMLSRG